MNSDVPPVFFRTPDEWLSHKFKDVAILYATAMEKMAHSPPVNYFSSENKIAYGRYTSDLIAAVQSFGATAPGDRSALQEFEARIIDFIAKASRVNPSCVHDAITVIKLFVKRSGGADQIERTMDSLWKMAKAAHGIQPREAMLGIWAEGAEALCNHRDLETSLRHVIKTAEKTRSESALPERRDLMHFACEKALHLVESRQDQIRSRNIKIDDLDALLVKIAECSLKGSEAIKRARTLYADLGSRRGTPKDLREAVENIETSPDDPKL